MRNLTPSLWYSTWTETPDEREATACVNVERLADALPHGSGIDGGYSITCHKNGSVTVRSEFHEMDANGSYCGWKPFSVRFFRLPDGTVDFRNYGFDPDVIGDMFADVLAEVSK